MNYIDKNYDKFKIVGNYDPINKSITFINKKFEKDVHNKIRTVTLNMDNNIREATNIVKNTQIRGDNILYYKCPTCSRYHQHGSRPSIVGSEIVRGTHCHYSLYGPSEEGNVKIVITENTKHEYPKIPKSKYNLGDKENIIKSNFCTN